MTLIIWILNIINIIYLILEGIDDYKTKSIYVKPLNYMTALNIITLAGFIILKQPTLTFYFWLPLLVLVIMTVLNIMKIADLKAFIITWIGLYLFGISPLGILVVIIISELSVLVFGLFYQHSHTKEEVYSSLQDGEKKPTTRPRIPFFPCIAFGYIVGFIARLVFY